MILAELTNNPTQAGIGLGVVLAVTLSWDRNKSILWAIIAGLFSWFYVVYFAFTRTSTELPRNSNR